MCKPGNRWSAAELNSEPTEAEWVRLNEMGFHRVTIGERFKKSVCCPVNGDGYWYTRRLLLDPNGFVVGSMEDEKGPRGIY